MFIAKVTHSKLTDKNTSQEFDKAQDAWYHIMDCLEDDQDTIYDALHEGGAELPAILKNVDYVAYREALDAALEMNWDETGAVTVPVGAVATGDGVVYGVTLVDEATQPV